MVFGKAKLIAFSHLFFLSTPDRFLPYVLACSSREFVLDANINGSLLTTDITAGFGSFREERTRSVLGQLLRRIKDVVTHNMLIKTPALLDRSESEFHFGEAHCVR